MKISVVIPVYNEEESLPKLLTSLQNQDFPKNDYEIIVVDNNSFDKTAAVAKQFGVTLIHESRKGITYARDTGARLAKGEIIVCADADCILPKNHLTKVYSFFRNDKKIFSMCGAVYMPKAPRIVRLGAKIVIAYAHYYSKIYNNTPICWAPNFAYRKSAFNKVYGYNLNLPLLQKGINADGTDEYTMIERFHQKGGKTLFNKHLFVHESGRRFRHRFIYWLIVEYLVGFALNRKLYRWFGTIIPTPSYYERVSPKNFYRYFYSGMIVLCLAFIGSSYFVASQKPTQELAKTAEIEVKKKMITMKSDLMELPEKLNFSEKITPYLQNFIQ